MPSIQRADSDSSPDEYEEIWSEAPKATAQSKAPNLPKQSVYSNNEEDSEQAATTSNSFDDVSTLSSAKQSIFYSINDDLDPLSKSHKEEAKAMPASEQSTTAYATTNRKTSDTVSLSVDSSHETKASHLQEPSKDVRAKNEPTETQAKGDNEPVELNGSHVDQTSTPSDSKRKTEDEKQISQLSKTKKISVDRELQKQELNKENETDGKPSNNNQQQVTQSGIFKTREMMHPNLELPVTNTSSSSVPSSNPERKTASISNQVAKPDMVLCSIRFHIFVPNDIEYDPNFSQVLIHYSFLKEWDKDNNFIRLQQIK
jgi:hypothetical protein